MAKEQATEYFAAMAKKLGLPKQDVHHYALYQKAIYNLLYLNLGNLFAGPGGVNQSIGFAADPLARIARIWRKHRRQGFAGRRV